MLRAERKRAAVRAAADAAGAADVAALSPLSALAVLGRELVLAGQESKRIDADFVKRHK